MDVSTQGSVVDWNGEGVSVVTEVAHRRTFAQP